MTAYEFYQVLSGAEIVKRMDAAFQAVEENHGELVYRIENASGQGPYTGSSLYVFDSVAQHPGPHQDPALAAFWTALGYNESQSYSFGFSSLGQLRHWFHRTEWLVQLHERGFVVKVYRAADVHHGDKQSLFKKPLSTVVEEIPLLASRVLGA